jgi:hypothetical protein
VSDLGRTVPGMDAWETPVGPPEVPEGVPSRPVSERWLAYRSGEVRELPYVWVWVSGEWEPCVRPRGAGQDEHGWWFFVTIRGHVGWVHESVTRPWEPGPPVVSPPSASPPVP